MWVIPYITAIIPARNEAPRIAAVIRTALACPLIGQVVVVDDDSSDNTAAVAAAAGADTYTLLAHGGKGMALLVGSDVARSNVLAMLDADLIGLTSEHIVGLAAPVLSGEVGMSVGVVGGTLGDPLRLSGQRVMLRQVMEEAEAHGLGQAGYGAETLLTKAANALGLPITVMDMPGTSNLSKVQKHGLVAGTIGDATMLVEYVAANPVPFAAGAVIAMLLLSDGSAVRPPRRG